MNETIVTTEQMNALKALSETNMKVSEAKATLIKIEETKQRYFKLRDDEAKARVANIVAESAEALEQARQNYYETTQLYHTVSSFAIALLETSESVHGMVADFEREKLAWDISLKEQESSLATLRQEIDSDALKIQGEKEGIKRQLALLQIEKAKVADMRGTIEREINRMSKK